MLSVADGGVSGVLVHEGVVEQTELELYEEDSAGGCVDAGLGDRPVSDEFLEQLDALLASELISAGVEDFDHALAGSEMFDSPRPGGQHLIADDVVVHQLPVGDDHAVEAELVTQQVTDDLPVV